MFKTKLNLSTNQDKMLTTDEFIKRQILLSRIRKRKQRIKEQEELQKQKTKNKNKMVSSEIEEDYYGKC